MREEPLHGGNATHGLVKIGQTVHRPKSEHWQYIKEVLLHLEAKDFQGSPRYLGEDEQGRDILSFVDGWVANQVMVFSDARIISVGHMLRAFHDATRGSAWAAGQEAVVHGDLNVRNWVFVDERAVAILDFDTLEPGAVLPDIAYTAWGFCISSYWKERSANQMAQQTALFVDAYGIEEYHRKIFVDAIIAEQQRLIELGIERKKKHIITALQPAGFWDGVIAWATQDQNFLRSHRHVFEDALSVM